MYAMASVRIYSLGLPLSLGVRLKLLFLYVTREPVTKHPLLLLPICNGVKGLPIQTGQLICMQCRPSMDSQNLFARVLSFSTGSALHVALRIHSWYRSLTAGALPIQNRPP